MFALDLCRARLRYRLRLLSPLHVGGGGDEVLVRRQGKGKGRREGDYGLGRPAGNGDAEVTLPIHEVRGGRSRFLVPASSLRGVLRHHLTRRIRLAIEGQGLLTMERFRHDGDEVGPDGEPADWERRFGQVLIRMTFGSEARRGQLAITPALRVDPQAAAAQVRYGHMTAPDRGGATPRDAALRLVVQNRLDRITQASAEGGLRTVAALEEGQEMEGEMTLQNFACWQLGLLALAQGAAARGDVRLGGKTTAGFGRIELRFTSLDLGWHRRVAPRRGEGCFGIGEAARRMGLLDQEGTDRGSGLRGLREVGTSGGKINAQRFCLDPADRISLDSADPRFQVKPDQGLMGRCFHRIHTEDPQLIGAVLLAGAGRLRDVVLSTTQEVG